VTPIARAVDSKPLMVASCRVDGSRMLKTGWIGKGGKTCLVGDDAKGKCLVVDAGK